MTDMYSLSSQMRAAVMRFLARDDGFYHYQMVCTLLMPKHPVHKALELPLVVGLQIVQGFATAYADELILTVEVPIPLQMEMLTYSTDLQMDVEVYPYNILSRTRLPTPIFRQRYRALLLDRTDWSKKVGRGDLLPGDQGERPVHSQLLTVDINLIEDTLYVARKRRVNMILRDHTVEDALQAVFAVTGITNTFIVPPDNQKTYTNLVIPPMMSLAEWPDYIQDAPGYGVYSKGLNFYYTLGRAYVYPTYDTEVTKSMYTTHIYLAGDNVAPGLRQYVFIDRDNQKDHHILIASGSTRNIDESLLGLENQGNAVVVQDSALLDRKPVDTYQDPMVWTDGISHVLKLTNTAGMSEGAFTPRFAHSNNNLFTIATDMAKKNVVTLVVPVECDIPMCHLPGQKVLVHFDDTDSYRTRTAVIDSITTSIQMVDFRGDRRVYSCTSIITISMANDALA